MAFAKTWNNDFHIKPTGADLVGQVDNFIVETRQAIEERVNLEHHFDRLVNAEQGAHRQGSARVWVAEEEPTSPVPDSTNTGAVTDLNVGRLWVVVDGSNVPTGEIKVHDGSNWVSVNQTNERVVYGDDEYKTVTKSSGSFNDIEASGFYYTSTAVTDGPVSAHATNLIVIGLDASTTVQLAYVIHDSAWYVRTQASGTWAAWSGFNAEKLNGLVSSVALPAPTDKSSIVARDTNGDFAGRYITATTFVGTATLASHVPTSKPDSVNGAIWVS